MYLFPRRFLVAVWLLLIAGCLLPGGALAQEQECPPGAVPDGMGFDPSSADGGGYGMGGPGAWGPINCRQLEPGNPDLFYNFYVPPMCSGAPAQLYLCPRPVPALVGHTYYTYQPFMPHEYLYEHKRTYYRYYNDGRGMNRTRVKWSSPPSAKAADLIGWLRIPR